MQIPRYAFFDLDNTLYSYEQAHQPAQEVLISFLAKQLRLDIVNTAYNFESAKNIVKGRLGDVASSHSRLLYLNEFLNQHGISSRPSFVLSAEQIYWSTFLTNMFLFEGVKDFLTLLRMGSCKTILVTDLTSAIQYRKIGWLGLDNYFDLVVTSEDAGGDKISGLPEKLIAHLLKEENPEGWSIGDQDWDHLFRDSTYFLKKLDHSKSKMPAGFGNKFYSFDQLIKLLQETEKE